MVSPANLPAPSSHGFSRASSAAWLLARAVVVGGRDEEATPRFLETVASTIRRESKPKGTS